MDQDMLSENPGNSGWKNKLEDVEHLSTVSLQDKNAAWEKLHSRLHQPRRRTGALWYGAAAACLLIAVIVPLLITNKKQVEMVTNTNNLLPSATNKAAAQQQLPVKENILTVIPVNTKTVTIQTDQPVNHKKMNSDNVPVKSVIDPVVFIEQKDIPAVQTTTILPVQIPVAETTTAVAAKEKKKLKVVHINELGDPVLKPSNMTHRDDYSAIQFKLINQQVYTSSPIPANSIGFNISSSKNVPSN